MRAIFGVLLFSSMACTNSGSYDDKAVAGNLGCRMSQQVCVEPSGSNPTTNTACAAVSVQRCPRDSVVGHCVLQSGSKTEATAFYYATPVDEAKRMCLEDEGSLQPRFVAGP